jgi:predicted kinase
MKTVTLTRGLPASGKSTWAKQKIADNPGQIKRVNKDDLRAMIDDGRWSRDNEKFVLAMRDKLILEALREGKHVIVDDTNFEPRHFERIKQMIDNAGIKNVKVEYKDFNLDVEECIKRDLIRPNSVGEKVIRQMYNKYLKEKVEPVQMNLDLPFCYIFDIDGTLAIKGNRSPYDWEKVGEDKYNQPVRDLYLALLQWRSLKEHNKILEFIVMSGRDSVCRPQTEEWLEGYGMKYDHLYMRAEGDMRKDTVIKKEIYEQHIEGKYNVLGIFDDRNQVVDMWRELGHTVFQVADGDF